MGPYGSAFGVRLRAASVSVLIPSLLREATDGRGKSVAFTLPSAKAIRSLWGGGVLRNLQLAGRQVWVGVQCVPTGKHREGAKKWGGDFWQAWENRATWWQVVLANVQRWQKPERGRRVWDPCRK